jgi:hypothetical protein
MNMQNDINKLTIRGAILEDAKALTEGDRNQAYGHPYEGMTRLAQLISAYLSVEISAVDASVICCLLKISRVAGNPNHHDNYLDLAAYAAIAGECADMGGRNEHTRMA